MNRKLKRQQRRLGAIVEIPLSNGKHSYARILDTDVAFYDICTEQTLSIEEIINLPVLFITTVFDYAITKGYWTVIGNKLPLEKHLIEIPPKYTQDILNPDVFTLVYPDRQEQAEKDDCKGLEFWTIWQPEKMEERLEKHFGNKNDAYIIRMRKGEMYPNSPEIKTSIKKTIQALTE